MARESFDGDLTGHLAEVDGSTRALVAAMVRGEVPHPPMMTHLGLRLSEIGDGTAEMRVTPQAHHSNSGGVAHGGLAAALIDSVTGAALWTVVEPGSRIATIELHVTYVRAVDATVPELIGTADVVHAGGSIGVLDAQVCDSEGTLYATGRATYAIRPGPPP